jgi:DNA-binding XRE family transcriptional regulator
MTTYAITRHQGAAMTDQEQRAALARDLAAWRAAAALTAKGASMRLGIPARTIEHIEGGRGFRYPELLRLAMQAAK